MKTLLQSDGARHETSNSPSPTRPLDAVNSAQPSQKLNMLGPHSVVPVCEEKSRLRRLLADAESNHKRTLESLNWHIETIRNSIPEGLHYRVETARKAVEEARKALERHTAEHACHEC